MELSCSLSLLLLTLLGFNNLRIWLGSKPSNWSGFIQTHDEAFFCIISCILHGIGYIWMLCENAIQLAQNRGAKIEYQHLALPTNQSTWRKIAVLGNGELLAGKYLISLRTWLQSLQCRRASKWRPLWRANRRPYRMSDVIEHGTAFVNFEIDGFSDGCVITPPSC
jgi:hypothetical protein